VGIVTHYFPKVKAGVIKLSRGEIAVGDALHIKGHTTDFKQKVTSIEIDHVPIKKAKKGNEIGLLVKRRVRGGDIVFKM
jgi:translation elongation factor EF-1alpha